MSESDQTLRTDVVVIGSGPGGYVSAIRLGQLGKKVILVERDSLGGVCLNVGCIPSKALISAGKLVKNARNASKMGIDAQVAVDIKRLQRWKQDVVDKLVSGVSQLCKLNGVKIVHGSARFVSKNSLKVTGETATAIEFENAVMATGSSPIEIPGADIDQKRIISSTEALALQEVPNRMLIVGGGVIGLEIGMAYANLFGTQLTIVELTDSLLPGVEPQLVSYVLRSLRRLNATIYLKSRLERCINQGNSVLAVINNGHGEIKVEADYALVSVGRKPNSQDLGLEGLGVHVDRHGFVIVDEQLRTDAKNIFAIGDVVGPPLLAHKASREGIIAAETIAGLAPKLNRRNIPVTIYTDPEISFAGLNADEAKKSGVEVVSGKFSFLANGRALASPDSEGFAEVSADKRTGKILGSGIVGPEASDLISEAQLAIELGLTLEDLASTIHAHPTLPEAIMEAAANALGKAIHVQNRKETVREHD